MLVEFSSDQQKGSKVNEAEDFEKDHPPCPPRCITYIQKYAAGQKLLPALREKNKDYQTIFFFLNVWRL